MAAEKGLRGGGETARPGVRVWLKRTKLVCVAIAVVIVLIVLFQNKERAAFDILFWRLEAPQAVLLLGVFATGVLVGAFIARVLRRQRG